MAGDDSTIAASAAPEPVEPVAVPSGPPITRKDIVLLKDRVTQHLSIKDFEWVEVAVASYLSVALIDEQPVCLMIVASPSSGKTEVVMSLHDHEGAPRTHVVGTLNANALLSGKTDNNTGQIDPSFSLLL